VCIGQDFNSFDYLNCEVATNVTALKKHDIKHNKPSPLFKTTSMLCQ